MRKMMNKESKNKRHNLGPVLVGTQIGNLNKGQGHPHIYWDPPGFEEE
jgi:hypothetical protein